MAKPPDRVQVIKQESLALGGSSDDDFPFDSPIEPEEDALEAAGYYLQASGLRDEAVLIWRDGDNMMFEDVTVGSGVTLQQLLAGSGISGSFDEQEHQGLDTLVHEISEDYYEVVTYSGFRVINVTDWTDITLTTKVREQLFVYDGFRVDTATTIQYDENGLEVERLEEDFNYTGFRVTSVNATRIP